MFSNTNINTSTWTLRCLVFAVRKDMLYKLIYIAA